METKYLSRPDIKNVIEPIFNKKFTIQKLHDVNNNDTIYNIMSNDGLVYFELNILLESNFRLVLQRFMFSGNSNENFGISGRMFRMMQYLGEAFQMFQTNIRWSNNQEDDAYYFNNMITNEKELIDAGYYKENGTYYLNIYEEDKYFGDYSDLLPLRVLKEKQLLEYNNIKISLEDCNQLNKLIEIQKESLSKGVTAYSEASKPISTWCSSILQKVMTACKHTITDFEKWCKDTDTTLSDHVYFENENFKIIAFIDYDFGYCYGKYTIISKQFDLSIKSSVIFFKI